jgi:hypothetical protein
MDNSNLVCKSVQTIRTHFPDVNRVEVIDEDGRSYVKYKCNNVKICLQDDGYTLKLFLDKENNDEPLALPTNVSQV